MKSFFSVWNRKTLEYVAPAMISEKGEIFVMEDDGRFYRASDQNDLEIHFFDGTKAPVWMIKERLCLEEEFEEKKKEWK